MAVARTGLGERAIAAAVVCAGSLVASACTDDIRSPRVLTEDPVGMAVSVAVVEAGPYSEGIVPMPLDRPRAEVLPLDTIELDALVANLDGPLALDDAAWVLCRDVCTSSLPLQGRRYGELPACDAVSSDQALACLGARGARPRMVLPDVTPRALPGNPFSPGGSYYSHVGVVVGGPDGPTTDDCLQQLVQGPQVDLVGCGIAIRDVPYGPSWAMVRVLTAAGYQGLAEGELPPDLFELLPPNAAPQIEQVRVATWEGDYVSGPTDLAEPEPQSIEEVLEVEASAWVRIEPVVSPRDLQISLNNVGPGQWLGVPDSFFYNVWTDEPGVEGLFGVSYRDRFELITPPYESTMRLYVVVTDSRSAASWFTLELQVVER